MGELSIKVTIASRVYPLSVKDNEEEKIRKAAKVINELIKNFETKYAVKDKQDLLAMCALQFASQIEQKALDKVYVNEEVEQRLKALDQLLSEHLSS